MLKMAPFLTHIFMESWPCFFEIRVPTNGNICQSHFSNVNEMDGAAIHCGQKDFISWHICQIRLQWNINKYTQDVSQKLSLSADIYCILLACLVHCDVVKLSQ